MQAHSIGLFFKRSCLWNERVDNVRVGVLAGVKGDLMESTDALKICKIPIAIKIKNLITAF
ncbi:hypothetical protein VN0324_08160 [Helicobacter pylori]|nr:hypothetical protein VN0324_08160 [Helicobacter pylori]